jgi:hypothetical protein
MGFVDIMLRGRLGSRDAGLPTQDGSFLQEPACPTWCQVLENLSRSESYSWVTLGVNLWPAVESREPSQPRLSSMVCHSLVQASRASPRRILGSRSSFALICDVSKILIVLADNSDAYISAGRAFSGTVHYCGD